MPSFDNTMNISTITFWKKARCFCPLGQDHYTNNFTVEIGKLHKIPDYIDIEKEIDENVVGKELTLEDAVAKVFEIVDAYSPKTLVVKSFSNDAVHFAVEVVKEK
jgi:hypothetical protein